MQASFTTTGDVQFRNERTGFTHVITRGDARYMTLATAVARLKLGRDVREAKDASGHEHAADGKFGSGGASKKELAPEQKSGNGELAKIHIDDLEFPGGLSDEVSPLRDNERMPIIVQDTPTGYKLIDGFGRASGMKNAGKETIHAIIVTEGDIRERRGAGDDPSWVAEMHNRYAPRSNLRESKDAEGHEHASDSGQFTSGSGGAKKGEEKTEKPKHGERAAKAHAKYAELIAAARKERIDAFHAVKKDAETAHAKVAEHTDAITDATGHIAWDSDNDDEQAFTDLESLVNDYDPDALPGERYSALKEIESTAKEALATKQKETATPELHEEREKLTSRLDEMYVESDKLQRELKATETRGDSEAGKKLVAKKEEWYKEYDSIKAKIDDVDSKIDDGLTPKEVNANKEKLQGIVDNARSARRELKAYIHHRREMRSIKRGQPMDMTESHEPGFWDNDGADLMESWAWSDLMEEGFTGIDPHGHKWVSGKQVKRDDAEPNGEPAAKAEEKPTAAGKTPWLEKGLLAAINKIVPTGGDAHTEQGAIAKVYHYLHDKGAAGFAKLPTVVQKAVSGAIAVAFVGYTASQELAERVAKERGCDDRQAATLRTAFAAMDLAAFKGAAGPMAALGPAGVAASWTVPPVTAAYLVTASVSNPMAAFRAAKSMVADIIKVAKDKVAEHTQTLSEGREANLSEGWVTIGAKDHEGGTHVFIGKGGKIEKGPKGLKGKSLSAKKPQMSKEEVAKRQQLKEQLGEKYWGNKDAQPYYRPGENPTVDNVITRDGKDGPEVLLIQRKKGTVEGEKWALPGGFHDPDESSKKGMPWKEGKETAEDAALRELAEETGLDASSLKEHMKHTGTYEGGGRDPRDNAEAWSKSNAFHLHLPPELAAKSVAGLDDAQDAKWVPLSTIEKFPMAFDHGKIISEAVGKKSIKQPSTDAGPKSLKGDDVDKILKHDSKNPDAKTDTKTPSPTPAQLKAIHKYTGAAYRTLNDQLRKGMPDSKLKQHQEVHNELQGLFKETKPLADPIKTYRGMEIKSQDQLNGFLQKMTESQKEGKAVEFSGYMSTSHDPDIAEGFLTGKGSVLFEITAKHGVDVSAHSKIADEKEFLLNHGSKFKVHSVEKNSRGAHVVKLEQVTG